MARRRLFLTVVLGVVLTSVACVGSGKTARTASIEPLPPGIEVVSDVATGCRDGESGFDYRFVVVGRTDDLSARGPLLSALRDRGFYHSILLRDDLPWVTIGYQHDTYALRAEIGPLTSYLANPLPHQGPPVESLPIDVRAQANQYVLIAMRPTDFACSTPL